MIEVLPTDTRIVVKDAIVYVRNSKIIYILYNKKCDRYAGKEEK